MSNNLISADLDLDSICADIDTRQQYVDAGRQPSVTAFLTNSLIERVPAMAAEILRQRDVIKRLIDFRNVKVAEANELTDRLKRVRAAAQKAENGPGYIESRELLTILGEPHPAESRPTVQLDNPDTRTYLIWSNHHKAWFAPKGCGYVANLADAGVFTLAETSHWLGRGCHCCQVPEVVVSGSAVNQLDSAATARVIAEATQAVIDAGHVNKHYTKTEVPA